MSGMLAIVNASEADYEKLTGAIEGCDGAAERMAETRMDNLAGDVQILKSSFEGLQLAVSESANGIARDMVQSVSGMLSEMNQAYAANGIDGMLNAFTKGFPKLLSTVIGVAEKLVSEVTRKLPDLLRRLVGELPGILENLLTGLPEIAEGIFAGITAVAEQIITDLPRLVPMFIEGVLNLAQSVIKGVAGGIIGITRSLLGLLSEQKTTVYESLGTLDGKLTYDVDTTAEVDNSGAHQAVDAAMGEFKETLKGYGLTEEQIAEILAFKGTQAELEAMLAKKYPNLTEAQRNAIAAKFKADQESDAEIAESIASELEGLGLDAELIAQIIGYKATGNDAALDELLKASLTPDLYDAVTSAIKNKWTDDSAGASGAEAVSEELQALGLTPEMITNVLGYKAAGNDKGLEEYLKATCPELYGAVMNVISTKWTEDAAAQGELSSELQGIGLTNEQIAMVIGYKTTGDEKGLDAYLKESLTPDLYDAASKAIAEKWNDDVSGQGDLVGELQNIGLTNEQIAAVIGYKATGNATALDAYLKGSCPDVYAAATQAIKDKWIEGAGSSTGSSGAQAAAEALGELGLTNEQIAQIIGWYSIGDTASIAAYLAENGCPDLTQAVTDALEANWDPSAVTLTSGIGDTSVNFVTQALVDMFTDGIKDDDESVNAALENAKGVIDAKKQELIDYINSGQDTDGAAAGALAELNELEAALTDYAANYANASTDECEKQGQVLLQMANQCQDAVDSIVAQTERLLSHQERLYIAGVSGSKLDDADLVTAMNYIAASYKDASDAAESEKERLFKETGDYETAQAVYTQMMADAQAENLRMIGELLAGQTEGIEGLDVASALSSVWDQMIASLNEGDGTLYQSELENYLREAGFGDDLIGKAIAAVFGEQTYTGLAGYGDIVDAGLDDTIADILLDSLPDGGASADYIANVLKQHGYESMIPQVLSALFTADNMSVDNLDYAALMGGFDFGSLGEILATAVKNGLIENTDDIDINQLILSLIAGSYTTPTVTTDVNVETGKTEVADDVPEKIAEAVQEAAEEAPEVETTPTVTVKSVEAAEESPLEDLIAEQLAAKGVEIGVDASVSLNVTVSDSNAEAIGTAVGETLGSSIATGVGNKSGEVNAEATTVVSGAVTAAKSTTAYQKMQSAGQFAMSGFAAGMRSKAAEIYKLAKEIADNVARTMANALEIKSPSRVTMQLGEFTGEGYGIGLRNSLQNAVRTAENVVAGMNLNTRVLPDFESAVSGAVNSVYAAESGRPVYLILNGKTLARAVNDDMRHAANNANRRIGLGVGK